MNYLSVENISKSFGERVLFKDVSFGIDKGQKLAFVAKNGAGKTTLLKLLTGKDVPDTGKVVWRKDVTVGFLDQLDETDNMSVKDFFFNDPKYDIIAKYEDLAVNAPESEAFQEAIEEMTRLNAWDIEERATKILSAFGIVDTTLPTTGMSGGEIKRLCLAKVLFDEPDVLILDEPTNHLDLDMIEWLEKYLTQQNVTLFMVTHDRYFLDNICDQILELDDQQLFKYKGNFTYYLEKRQERLVNQQQVIDKANNLFKKELDWIRRQPKARGTKAKSRVDAFDDIKKVATTKIDKSKLELSVQSQRMGTKIIEFHKVSKSFGDLKILDNFTYNFKRFEKIGIVGKNGVGKTSFVNLILNKLEPDAGKIVIGDTISFGYYDQKGLAFKDDQKVIDVVKEIADYIPLEKGKTITASQMLERFFFPKNMHYNFVYKLSGGEKKRLYLLRILMGNPNFLIMDEPTNDLDIFTIAALENFLEQFTGCLIVISHDRYFLDKICDHMFYLKGEGQVKDILGNYYSYRNHLIEEKNQAKSKKIEVKKEVYEDQPKKVDYNLKKEYNKLEKEIDKLEKKKKQLEQDMYSHSENPEKLIELGKESESLSAKIEEKTERWMELAELMD